MAIFRFFQDGGRRHLGFSTFQILTVARLKRLNCFDLPSLVEIDQTVAEIWQFFDFFQDGGCPPSWICCVNGSTTTKGVLGGLYHCAKFGWNRCGSFDNMQVLVFCDFGLKTPIHAPFGAFWALFPLKNVTHHPTHKRTVLGRNHVIWAIKREYRPRWASCIKALVFAFHEVRDISTIGGCCGDCWYWL